MLQDLEAKAAKVTRWGDIIYFENRSSDSVSENSELPNELRASLLCELMDQKLRLDDCHAEVNYTQDGLKRLQDELESAKKLVMSTRPRL